MDHDGEHHLMSVPRRLIGWLSGTPTTTTIPVVVLSDTDAPITISVYNDAARTSLRSTFTVTASTGGGTNPGNGATNGLLTKYCDDRTDSKLQGGTAPQPDALGRTFVCWIGRHTLTGLVANTRYHITLTQGVVTEGTVSGDGISTCTAPDQATDYKLWCLSCDRISQAPYYPTFDEMAVEAGTRFVNAYGFMKRWQKQNPTKLAYIWFVDDFGYADDYPVVDTIKTTAGPATAPEIPTAPTVTRNGYDFGLFYTHGMLGMGMDTSIAPMMGGRQEDRAWSLRNYNLILTQWGDHEFGNQFGWAEGKGRLTAPDLWNAASMAWGELFDHLNAGARLNTTPGTAPYDVAPRHLGVVFGDAYLCSPDGKTNMGLTQGVAAYTPAELYTEVVEPWYGTAQIDDILTALDNSAPFKIIGKADGDKAYADYFETPQQRPNHQMMKLANLSEWERLFTRSGATPPSLMDNNNTNGTNGVLVTWNGDVHLQMWAHHGAAAHDSQVAEDFSAWFTGTVTNHPQVPPTHTSFIPYVYNGGVFDGTKIHFISNSGLPWDYTRSVSHVYPQVSCLSIDVLGASSPKQLVCQLYDDGEVKAKAIYEPGSNRPVSPLPWERVGYIT
jgi:hypothetical protein